VTSLVHLCRPTLTRCCNLLTKVNLELYTKYLSKEKGKDVMYVCVVKTLYGALQAALLFWKELSGYLILEGFEVNLYNNCVANKMINGAQCNMLWQVDDLKLLHVADQVLDKLVKKLDRCYWEIAPLTVTKGTVHDYAPWHDS
jgi:hypothetical protein